MTFDEILIAGFQDDGRTIGVRIHVRSEYCAAEPDVGLGAGFEIDHCYLALSESLRPHLGADVDLQVECQPIVTTTLPDLGSLVVHRAEPMLLITHEAVLRAVEEHLLESFLEGVTTHGL